MNKIKIVFLLFLILIISLPAFLPCLKNGFVWDDRQYLIENSAVQALSFKNVTRIFTSFTEGNYHPVTFLSYLLEFHFFKLNPAGYHLINLILHLFNSLLVFWLFMLLTRSSAVSFITSILFAIHPLHVESVAWVSGRKDVLYAFFFITAIISYLYYLKKRKGNAFYLLSLFLFILSVLSKSMAVSLPLVLFLIDYLSGRKFDKTALLDKVPFFVLSIVFAVIGFVSQYTGGAVRQEPLVLYDSILNACYAVVFYLNKALAPVKLACFYPYPGKIEKLISFLGLCMILFILIKLLPMADLVHLKQHFGSLEKLRGKKIAMSWAYSPSYGKPLSVPQGIIGLMTRFGINVTLAHPEGYGLIPEVVELARKNAKKSGGSFQVVNSMEESFRDADVVYPKSWAPFP